MSTVLVALAGATGAAARYRIGMAIGLRSFPWATLLVNVVGCVALALILAGYLLLTQAVKTWLIRRFGLG